MEEKILFIVIDGEIKFLKTSTMDHKEWYQSLGGDPELYDNVIRGFVMEGKLIFFKANLNYDSEVIDFATKMAIPMKKQLNQPDLKVCCGIEPGHDGQKWEAILTLKEEDLDGYVAPVSAAPSNQTEDIILHRNDPPTTPGAGPIPEMPEQLEIQKQKEEEEKKLLEQQLAQQTPAEPIIEFKNDLNDPEFIKAAVKFTIILIVAAVVAKILLVATGKLDTSSRGNTLLIFIQIGGLIFSIVGYNQKLNKTKYIALASAAASVFLFDIMDIVIGVLIFLFTIDHTYVKKMMEFAQWVSKKGKEKAQKVKTDMQNKSVKK